MTAAFFYLVAIIAFAVACYLTYRKYADKRAESNYMRYKAQQTKPRRVDVERAGRVRAGEREWLADDV